MARTWTAIRIGRDDFGVPKHLMQGEKMEGIITDGSSIRPWYWEGFATIDDWQPGNGGGEDVNIH